MRKVPSFTRKGAITSGKKYARVFDSLMKYTDFTDARQIKTKEDLFDFFKQVQEDANSKKRGFRIGGLYDKVVEEKFNDSLPRTRTVADRRKIIQSQRAFKNAKEANKAGFALHINNQRIFKSFIMRNNKKQIRWRSDKGRFVKQPKEV